MKRRTRYATLIKRPLGTEICEGCGKTIHRNLARLDGVPYHFGCLKKTKAKPTHYCLDCYSYLTGAKIVKTYHGGPRPVLSCGVCGSPRLKPLGGRWRK